MANEQWPTLRIRNQVVWCKEKSHVNVCVCACAFEDVKYRKHLHMYMYVCMGMCV